MKPPTVPASGIQHLELRQWIEEMAALCRPDHIHVCDGSERENADLCDLMVRQGTFIRLNETKRPNCFLSRSDPRDVAREIGRASCRVRV